jgi:hypothetical protein
MRGAEKAAAETGQKNDGVDEPDVADEKVVQGRQGNQCERGSGEEEQAVGDAQDGAAAHHVGDVAGQERNAEGGHRLRQPDEAKLQGVVRQLVNLPADGDALNLDGGRAKQPVKPERAVVGHAKSRVGVRRRGGGLGHFRPKSRLRAGESMAERAPRRRIRLTAPAGFASV